VPDSSPQSTCVLFGRFMSWGQSVDSCPGFFVNCTAILDTVAGLRGLDDQNSIPGGDKMSTLLPEEL